MITLFILILIAMVAAVVAIMAGTECDCCEDSCPPPEPGRPVPEPEPVPIEPPKENSEPSEAQPAPEVVGFEHLHIDHDFSVLDEIAVPEEKTDGQ